MGKRDTYTKQYIARPLIFADAFNYLLYNGRQVIKPDALKPVDTTEVIIPYGNNAEVPVQKYRDNMKIWAAMQDDDAVYVLLGSENQSSIHYAMPVKDMLYDSINYATQVDAARQSYKNFKFDEDGVKISLTRSEFLSGFRKGDKLMPVITAVIYFGAEEWDAPMSIHEMLNVREELLPFISNYHINLIAPANIPDSDFSTKEAAGKFHTGFGTLMQVIKHQNEIEVADILSNAPKIDEASADMIAEVANIKFEKSVDEKGEVDMCKGMEEYTLKSNVEAVIGMLRDLNMPEEEITERVAKKFNVTVEYVKNLMTPKTA